MEIQSYSNHTQIVPAFHRVLIPVLVLAWIGSAVNLYQSWGDHQRLYSASLLFVLTGAVNLLALLARIFALKAQDRAIRAEENLRHFVLTGKLLDSNLTIKQIAGLRFASDAEFPDLARRAAQDNLTGDAVKRAVKNWRSDTYRV
jgi:hypothetical protein